MMDISEYEGLKKEIYKELLVAERLSKQELDELETKHYEVEKEYEKEKFLLEKKYADLEEFDEIEDVRLGMHKKYLQKLLDDIEPCKKIYYVTPRIKNLEDMEKQIGKFLEQAGKAEYKEELIKIEALREKFKKNKECLNLIPIISEWEETKKLSYGLKNLYDSKEKELKNAWEEKIFEEYNSFEYKFRSRLIREFKNAYKSRRKANELRMSKVQYMKNSEWKFIEELYPTVKTIDKDFFLLTSKMFFLSCNPIIEARYSFTSKENIKNAIVIFDEIDFIKEEMLDNILGSNHYEDIINIFNRFSNTFSNFDRIDEQFFTEINAMKSLNDLKAKCLKIMNQYFPVKPEVKAYEQDGDRLVPLKNHQYLLNYMGSHHYYNHHLEYNYYPYKDVENDKDKFNKLLPSFYQDCKRKGCEEIKLIKDITKYVDAAYKRIGRIGYKYLKLENEKIKANNLNKDILNVKQAISTVLVKLNIDRIAVDKMADSIRILMGINDFREEKKLKYLQESIYGKGLQYNTISQNTNVRDTHFLNVYKIPYTPELVLLDLCKRANVIGLSATATVPSINNFNWNFFRKYLVDEKGNSLFHSLSKEDVALLKQDYYEKTTGYELVDTRVEPICIEEGNSIKDDFIRLYSREYRECPQDFKHDEKYDLEYRMEEFIRDEYYGEIKFKLQKTIANAIEENNNEVLHNYKRLKKIWAYLTRVIELYHTEGVISNGIIFTNKLFDTDKEKDNVIYDSKYLKLGALYILGGILAKEYEDEEAFRIAKEKIEQMFYVINAEDLKDEQQKNFNEKFREHFEQKDLIFMVTSYQSISRGNNLQINIGKEAFNKAVANKELVFINNWHNREYVDWDSIYMEKPSYMIPALSKLDIIDNKREVNEAKEVLKTLLKIEEMLAYHQLDYNRQQKILEEIFNIYTGISVKGNSPYYNALYKLKCVKMAYSIYIYQTIGRIARTNVKKKYNAIFYDVEMLDRLELNIETLKLPIISHEFQRFIVAAKRDKKALAQANKEIYNDDYSARNTRSNNCLNHIIALNAEGWSEPWQEFWEYLRQVVLRYPIITSKEKEKVKLELEKFSMAKAAGFSLEDVYLPVKKAEINSTMNYFYGIEEQSDGLKKILIPKDLKCRKPQANLDFEVSIYDSRLNILLKNEIIKKHWEKEGFNQDWQVKEEGIVGIINPAIYKNIYKGAIGEQVVKSIFDEIGYPCNEIRDPLIYEKFDFVIKKDDKRVYIDAKNFSDGSLESEIANQELLSKVTKKIANVDMEHAFIINLVDELAERSIVERNKLIAIPGLFKVSDKNTCEEITLKESTLMIDLKGDLSVKKFIQMKIESIFAKE